MAIKLIHMQTSIDLYLMMEAVHIAAVANGSVNKL